MRFIPSPEARLDVESDFNRTLSLSTGSASPLQCHRTAVIDALGHATTFTHSNGQVMAMQDCTGAVTTFNRDNMNRVISIVDPLGNTTTYAYNLNSQVTSITDPLGDISTLVYTQRRQVSAIVNPLNEGDIFQRPSVESRGAN